MIQLEPRTVVTLDLPIKNGITLLRPENAVLRFGYGRTVDVGALCYIRRDTSSRPKRGGHAVDFSSFCPKRAENVRALIDFFAERSNNRTNRPSTQEYVASVLVKSFMDFADSNGFETVLGDPMAARNGFHRYVQYLRELVANNSLAVNTAAGYQNCILDLLSRLHEIDNLSEGVNLIRRDDNATVNTRPACEEAQSKVLALCECLFGGFSALAVDNLPYPYQLEMPKYLNWERGYLWVFPTLCSYMAPFQLAKRKESKRPTWGFDYENGRVAEFQDIRPHYPENDDAWQAIALAQSAISKANSDPDAYSRRACAMTAHNVFMLLFVANTAMNSQQLSDLLWDDDYEVGEERQGFRAIKWRAGGRKCYFEISARFLPQFKRFLQLRSYLLKGTTYEYLFFSLGPRRCYEPTKIGRHTFSNIYTALRSIDPELPRVSPREWRASKSDWLIRKTDVATTARVLQNSERTVLKHYTAGSETSHLEEMGAFLEGVSKTVLDRGVNIEGVDQAVGFCLAHGMPQAIHEGTPISPDCRKPEGCLFCDMYRLHADERDTRKLLSCRYCLQQTSHLAANEEHFQRLFGPIFARIEDIIKEIDRREAGIVTRVLKEVEEGELDPYWASKLEMLVSLELVV